MICERTYDTDVIRSVLTDPEIFARISESGLTDKHIVLDTQKEAWLTMSDEGLIGAICLTPLNSVCVDIHVHILEDFRDDYAMASMIETFKFFMGTDYEKITASIPECHADVCGFALKVGFKEEGLNRASYRRDGEIISQRLFGITRNEVSDFLDGAK